MSLLESIVHVPVDIDKALQRVGSNSKYQYLVALCAALIWWSANSFTIGLGYDMILPDLRCRDGSECSYSRACREGGYTYISTGLHNMAYDWDLVCARQYLGSLIGVANFLGIALGSLLASYMTNACGRKKAALTGMTMQLIGQIAAYFTPSAEIMIAVSCELGISLGLATMGIFVLLLEMTDSDHRSWFVGIMFASCSLAGITQPGLFYLCSDWRQVLLPYIFLTALAIPLLCVIHESVRYLAVNLHDKEATLKAFEAIARFNGREGAATNMHFPAIKVEPEISSFKDLFSSWKLIYRVVALGILQIMMNLGYYGVYYAIPSYFGNIYVNGVIIGLGEMIPFLASGRLIGKVPRKLSNFTALLGQGVVLLLAWACLHLSCSTDCALRNWVQTSLLFLGVFMVASYCVAMATLSTEAFNSHTRGPAIGLLNGVAMLGGALSTLLVLIQTNYDIPPLIMIGGAACASTLLIFTLPETLGRHMEECS